MTLRLAVTVILATAGASAAARGGLGAILLAALLEVFALFAFCLSVLGIQAIARERHAGRHS